MVLVVLYWYKSLRFFLWIVTALKGLIARKQPYIRVPYLNPLQDNIRGDEINHWAEKLS